MRKKIFMSALAAASLFFNVNVFAQESREEEPDVDIDIPAKDPVKPFKSPEVASLNRDNVADAYPFISGDGLRLYYSSSHNASFSNLYISERKSIKEPFGEARLLCPSYETGYYCATFTADEQTMYLGKSGHIYVARRSSINATFGEPELVEGLPGGFIFAPAISPNGEELVLVTDSNPDDLAHFKMTSYKRATPADGFAIPPTEYKEPGTGQFSKDGLQYYLSVYTQMNKSVILRGSRTSLKEQFTNWEELKLGPAGVSVAGQPTVNADGTILLFISSPNNSWNGDDLVYATDFDRNDFAKNANVIPGEKVTPAAAVMIQAKLYPNPAVHSVTFELVAEPGAEYTLWLVDMNGRRVKQQRIVARRSIINLEGLTSGIYIYELRDDTGKLVAGGKLVRTQ
ncbi:MAG: T9SS type A sorting domain-containing protein [Chitinophagaceae bacterium]|nr:T9SS type A sorting domain-containing protein [Chitinophagaceae bacterium]